VTRRWRAFAFALAALALILLTALAFAVGRFPIAPGELAALAANKFLGAGIAVAPNVETVVLQVRAPRILAALLVGAALAAAGTAYQGMFRNPLVSPDILGVSAGAALGAVLGIFFSQNVWVIQLGAFAGGLAAVGIVYAVGAHVRRQDPVLSLILAGIVIGTLLGAFIALLKYLADPYNQLPAITYWLLGSLAEVAPRDLALAAPFALAGLVPLYLPRWRMNMLSLTDDEVRVLREIRRLAAEGYAVVFSTHDPGQAFLAASRVLLLAHGGALRQGAPPEVITPQNLREVYGVEVRVAAVDGARVCLPAL
jgi:iron complex transport system permease protein